MDENQLRHAIAWVNMKTLAYGEFTAYEWTDRKEFETLPCWVRDDLNEDDAYMLLATDNNQGELSPLEIGVL